VSLMVFISLSLFNSSLFNITERSSAGGHSVAQSSQMFVSLSGKLVSSDTRLFVFSLFSSEAFQSSLELGNISLEISNTSNKTQEVDKGKDLSTVFLAAKDIEFIVGFKVVQSFDSFIGDSVIISIDQSVVKISELILINFSLLERSPIEGVLLFRIVSLVQVVEEGGKSWSFLNLELSEKLGVEGTSGLSDVGLSFFQFSSLGIEGSSDFFLVLLEFSSSGSGLFLGLSVGTSAVGSVLSKALESAAEFTQESSIFIVEAIAAVVVGGSSSEEVVEVVGEVSDSLFFSLDLSGLGVGLEHF